MANEQKVSLCLADLERHLGTIEGVALVIDDTAGASIMDCIEALDGMIAKAKQEAGIG